MAKIDYERLNQKVRVQLNARDPFGSTGIKTDYVPKESLRINFGVYEGWSLEGLFFLQLPEFYDLLMDRYCEGCRDAQTPLGARARFIANRACNILPPGPDSGSKEFLITLDREAGLRDFEIVRKGRYKKWVRSFKIRYKRVRVLDATLPFKFRDPELGLRHMGGALSQTFLSDKANFEYAAAAYFNNGANFDFSPPSQSSGL